MSDSDSADPFDPLEVFAGQADDEYGLWLGGHRVVDELLDSDSSDSDDELRDIDEDYLSDIERMRLPRERATYEYDGDMLDKMDNDAADPERDWAALPPWIESQRWMSEFCMIKKPSTTCSPSCSHT